MRNEGPQRYSIDRKATLEALSRALNREIHNLDCWPELTFQQLYNRLQWEDESVLGFLASDLERRSEPGARAWLRNRTPYRETRTLVRVLAGHTKSVNACAISPDGSSIVSASEDGSVRVWDAASGRERSVLRGHGDSVRACTINLDGSRVISAGDDGTVRLWDVFSGAQRNLLTGHSAAVKVLALSPDGKWLASASDDGTVRIWDLEAATEHHVLPVGSTCRGCAWVGSHWVATVDAVWGTRIWSAVAGTERLNLSGGRSLVECCAVSPDGVWVASGNMGLNATLWIAEAATGAELFVQSLPAKFVEVGAWSPDVSRLVVAVENGSLVAIYFQDEFRVGAVNVGPGWPVTRAAWSPDGKVIATGYGDGTLRLWGAAEGTSADVLEGHTAPVRDLAWSPDGAWLVSASDDGTLRIWDPAAVSTVQGKSIACNDGHPTLAVEDCTWSPDGGCLASVNGDGALRSWDGITGMERHVIEQNERLIAPLKTCAWSPDGSTVVTGSDGGKLWIWDATSGSLRQKMSCLRREFSSAARKILDGKWTDELTGDDEWNAVEAISINDCAWSPDGACVASACEDAALRIWDAGSGNLKHLLAGRVGFPNPEGHTAAVQACAWNPDGGFLASVGLDRQLIIWDPITGTPRHRLEGTIPLAWSPNGVWIASGGAAKGYVPDWTLRIWDVASGQERHVLDGHIDRVTDCAWRPDGIEIVSSSEDGTLRIWDAVSGGERQVLEGHSGAVHACAWSPDGAWIVSAGDDRTVHVWDARSGLRVMTMLVVGRPTCLSLHPSLPVFAAGDSGGTVYLLGLVGIEYGPIIVTTAGSETRNAVQCPACRCEIPMKRVWLGQEITCPQSRCQLKMRINPFVVNCQKTKPAISSPRRPPKRRHRSDD
jgi:WD40 repeat protein